jgi:predicted amidohydrolase
VRSLLAQLCPVPGAPQANAQRAAEIVAGADADLVVLPELWLSGYDLDRVYESAVELDSPELGALRQSAAGAATAIVVGFPERRGRNVANAAALIDARGELSAVYRKVQLFGQEQSVFEAGEELLVTELAGRRVGPLICFDMEFLAAQAGADEHLLAAEVSPEETGDDRIDYLAQLREGIRVKAATTVTGGST